MNNISFSNQGSRCQSTVSKSSNSSISSILRDSSVRKQKKKRSVHFEDSPVAIEKTITIKLNDIYTQLKSSPASTKSPSHSYLKPTKPTQNISINEMPINSSTSSPAKSPIKQTPKKSVPVQETIVDLSEISEPRFIPRVLNYAFRTPNFYNKLSQFYSSNSSQKNTSKKKISEGGNRTCAKSNQDKIEDSPVIRLRPCSMYDDYNDKDNHINCKSPSPPRENKLSVHKRRRRQN